MYIVYDPETEYHMFRCYIKIRFGIVIPFMEASVAVLLTWMKFDPSISKGVHEVPWAVVGLAPLI